jgi:hypothetical protein
MMVLGTPGRLLLAYVGNAALHEREELVVELSHACPTNGASDDAALLGALVAPPPGAIGPAKIRGGYDYREAYLRPTEEHPHSVCPGDCFLTELEQEVAEADEINALVYR